jgi:hypothetical protein
VDRKVAGIYARLAPQPLINHLAQDVAVLIPQPLFNKENKETGTVPESQDASLASGVLQ